MPASGLTCGACPMAYAESWPRGREVLRCGNDANGERRGYVVANYPAGHRSMAEGYPAPAWCVRQNEEE